jgi:hypothetical protein
MAYTINKTDGTVVTTITDGTVDNTTSLQLFGKSFSGFGEGLNENLVKLLENAASTSAPSAPLKGELWFDTSTNQLKVYDGTSFKPTGGAKTGMIRQMTNCSCTLDQHSYWSAQSLHQVRHYQDLKLKH